MSLSVLQSENENKLLHELSEIGLINPTKISNTLQGSIWEADINHSNKHIVVKATNKLLHDKSIIIISGKKRKIKENIMTEAAIQKYITYGSEAENCPSSIVKYINLFQTETHYILLMDYGGTSLFDFIVKIHHYVLTGNVSICELQKVVKVIFKQMIECVEYIHSKNVCHLDISLENFLINDVNVKIINDKLYFECDNIKIKLCDFGLAELFTDKSFLSTKFCGKVNYKSPEISSQKTFDAKSNDVWCLGVCLWMMITGAPPFMRSDRKSESFSYIMNGQIVSLLVAWNKIQYINTDIIKVFESVFQYEEKRCGLLVLKSSAFLKN